MPFNNQLPIWLKTGIKPPATVTDTTGWRAEDKPPADWLNWFINTVYLALQELQQESINADQKAIANGVATLDANAKTPVAQLPDATTSAKGAVQLNDATNSTSLAQAATANAVKKAYDLANSKANTTVASFS